MRYVIYERKSCAAAGALARHRGGDVLYATGADADQRGEREPGREGVSTGGASDSGEDAGAGVARDVP